MKSRIQQKFYRKVLFIILASLSLFTACGQGTFEPTDEVDNIDPIFRPFYAHLGGVPILGEAISPAFQEGEVKVQFTENAKMIFDLGGSEKDKFLLAPLGTELGLIEPAIEPPEQPDEFYCDGHSVAPVFQSTYDMIGKQFVGCPISEVIFNPIRNRYEQFFRNLGFYQIKESNEIGLLAYGSLACGKPCLDYFTGSIPESNIIDYGFSIHPVFHELVSELGTNFTGFGLSKPYIGKDGKFIQIFGNVALVAASLEDNRTVGIRSIVTEMHYAVEPPLPNSNNPSTYFYEIQNGIGYEVPRDMWEYIRAHGGSGISGQPVTHVKILSENSYYQCFTNLCIKYDALVSKDKRFQLEPLGYIYKSLFLPESLEAPEITPPPPTPSPNRSLILRDWKQFRSVSSQENQTVGVVVLEDYKPISNVKLFINITYPDGTIRRLEMSTTDANGISNIQLPLIEAVNGSLIHYDVCLPLDDGNSFCVGDSFPIWNNP